ncbi:ROK family transcriptional regulator [Actinocorallia sp. API 0066]|uniref:ROK family transcriptional regulator n=1 Tax=Actinocorallia sp. API 0066 TaxID=2896846 RepID=UPI001E3C3B52|nr:ROK family transcriptional regulator [Actinocorallia sp. API 0066]MCD0451071.1 ROK family transcriptional regulator [Actinocorallia sp. API 0066]
MHANSSQAPVRHGAMRAQNLGLVLGEVARGGPLTRAALAELTGLTKTTVSRLVADLLDAGLVAEAPAVPDGERGRPGVEISLSGDRVAALGLEVNVAYLAACVVDLTRRVRVRRVLRRDNRADRPAAVLAALAALGDAAVREVPGLRVAGTVLAIPGPVGGGRVHNAPNLGWRDVDVPALLGRPVTVENEANLAALGELEFGAAPRDFLYVSGETGVGAGLVSGGALFRGASGMAGELGHVAVASGAEAGGRACRCGATGCLEVFAGKEALPSPEALASGDPAALDACARAGRALGIALSSAVNLLDPGTIVLGGCYTPLFRWLSPPLCEVLAERLATLRPDLPVLVPSATGPDAAVLGAAGQVLQRVIADPAAYAEKTTDM